MRIMRETVSEKYWMPNRSQTPLFAKSQNLRFRRTDRRFMTPSD
jgi:hypothetical protein